MPLVAGYHRPTTLDEALGLLAEPNRIVLGGGTRLNADRAASELEAVDLQALGLDTIEVDDDETPDSLTIGAMATIADIAESELVPSALRRIAKAELPSTLRTVATIGGAVAEAQPTSVLLAALLAHNAVVTMTDGQQTLADVLAAGVTPGAIITSISMTTSGETATAGTARTPADTPIVAAVARRSGDTTVSLALTGVANSPVLVDPLDPVAGLTPTGDFRGSAAYRLHLARTLAARAVEAAQ